MDIILKILGIIMIVYLTIFPIVETVRYWNKSRTSEKILWSLNIIFATLLIIGITAN
jgi:uncharacterized membrane protein